MGTYEFDMLYFKDIDDEDYQRNLHKMKEWLQEDGYYELSMHLERIEQCFERAQDYHNKLAKVMEAYENYHHNNRISKEEFEKVMNNYLLNHSTSEVKEISSLTQEIRSLLDKLEQKRKELLDKLL